MSAAITDPMADRYGAAMGAFVPGKVIENKYRIESFLAAGAMAAVFRGTDTVLDRAVAIKVLYVGDPEMLRAEAKAMARLRHDNVVQVYSFGEHDGLWYIVMEFVEGTNLEKTIERAGPLPAIAAIGILEKIASGLDAAHAENIIHMDVKPANVLVGPRYRVCVTDFGLVGLTPNQESINGTPAYMAPETFLGSIDRGKAHLCDQYGLGCSAYEMFTGRVPFPTEDFLDLIRCHAQEPPPPMNMPGIPREVEVVVARSLAKQPEQRYPSCGAFAHALRNAWNSSALQIPSGPTVLIVDDDPAILQLFSAIVADTVPTARIATAKDGLVALEIVRATPPNLVLLDLQMPNLNGMEFLHHLRAEKNIDNMRIVAVSGLLGRERAVKGGIHIGVMLRVMGVAEQLPKPIDPKQLAEVVKKQLQLAIDNVPLSMPGSGIPSVRGR